MLPKYIHKNTNLSRATKTDGIFELNTYHFREIIFITHVILIIRIKRLKKNILSKDIQNHLRGIII